MLWSGSHSMGLPDHKSKWEQLKLELERIRGVTDATECITVFSSA
jgi:hypothetical protein